jgi:hypothetical protein
MIGRLFPQRLPRATRGSTLSLAGLTFDLNKGKYPGNRICKTFSFEKA